MAKHKTPKWIKDRMRARRALERDKKREQRIARGVKRTYYILHINCDCCSSLLARTNISRYMYGPRCPGCRRVLGCMEWNCLGTVQATGDLTALQEWDRKQKEKQK